MQTTKRSTGLRTAATDYVTLVQQAITQAVKKAGIVKEVSLHTLRHTYATHLLEQGVNILTIKELLGHAHINTTMVYLHLARPTVNMAFSPMDTLYTQGK
jgi:site-specific recombinase XerD